MSEVKYQVLKQQLTAIERLLDESQRTVSELIARVGRLEEESAQRRIDDIDHQHSQWGH